MTANAYVRARIEPSIKEDAELVLESLGLTVSDAVRMLLTRIARDKALPVEFTQPNAETIAAMEEAREILASKSARFDTAAELFASLEKK